MLTVCGETEALTLGRLGNSNPSSTLPARSSAADPNLLIPAAFPLCQGEGDTPTPPKQPPRWPLHYRETFQAFNQIILLREAQH